ncbi:MAG: hypothetical protein ACLFOY_18890 [Desulfatibacillaceae bacterium]
MNLDEHLKLDPPGDGPPPSLGKTLAVYAMALVGFSAIAGLFYFAASLYWADANEQVHAFLRRTLWTVLGIFYFVATVAAVMERFEARRAGQQDPGGENEEDGTGLPPQDND